EIERDVAEALLRRSDDEQLAIEARMSVVGQDACGKMRAVPPKQQHAPVGAAQQRRMAGTVDRHFHRVEPAYSLFRELACLGRIADAPVAAETELPRKPRKREDREKRAAQAQEQIEVHGTT